jgi:hypothetical protein
MKAILSSGIFTSSNELNLIYISTKFNLLLKQSFYIITNKSNIRIK